MPFQVWIWKEATSEWPEVCELVTMADAQEAVLVVMQAHGLRYAYYAWVSPVDESREDAHLYHVDCPGVIVA